MEITVNFTTQLKAALHTEQEQLQIERGATVMQALESLAANHAEAFSQLVLRNGKLLPSILLCVNDEQVETSHSLCDGDSLTLLSAISGG